MLQLLRGRLIPSLRNRYLRGLLFIERFSTRRRGVAEFAEEILEVVNEAFEALLQKWDIEVN
jgi:hypothetical protein